MIIFTVAHACVFGAYNGSCAEASWLPQASMDVAAGVEQPVPLGCLLDPICSDSLFQVSSVVAVVAAAPTLPVAPRAAHDPRDSVTCLTDPACSAALSLPRIRTEPFQRPVALTPVIYAGANVGDYVPAQSTPPTVNGLTETLDTSYESRNSQQWWADSPDQKGIIRPGRTTRQVAGQPSNTGRARSADARAVNCTVAVGVLDEAARHARTYSPGVSDGRRASILVLIAAYENAIETCQITHNRTVDRD
jgi:hypothetical protein